MPVLTSSVPPPPPPPPGGIPRPSNQIAKEEAMPGLPSSGAHTRNRGIVIVPESDVARLVHLEPGQRIAGMRDDHTYAKVRRRQTDARGGRIRPFPLKPVQDDQVDAVVYSVRHYGFMEPSPALVNLVAETGEALRQARRGRA